jgi:hypothetical protein
LICDFWFAYALAANPPSNGEAVALTREWMNKIGVRMNNVPHFQPATVTPTSHDR